MDPPSPPPGPDALRSGTPTDEASKLLDRRIGERFAVRGGDERLDPGSSEAYDGGQTRRPVNAASRSIDVAPARGSTASANVSPSRIAGAMACRAKASTAATNVSDGS